MRPILYTTPVLAWPPDKGDRHFLLGSARALQTLGPVTWLTRRIGAQEEACEVLRAEGFDLLLDEGFVSRAPWRRAIRRMGIDLRAMWRGCPREEEFVCTPRVLALARQWWKEHPEGLGVSAFWSASRTLDLASPGSRVLLASDVETHRMEMAQLCGAASYREREHRKLRRAEMRAFARADLVGFLTEEDRAAARKLLPSLDLARTTIWPTFLAEIASSTVPDASDTNRLRLLIYGHWKADFNRDGLEWFFEEVWPGLSSRQPSATLRVVGRGLEGISAPDDGVEFVGYVEDLASEIVASDVVLLPLRFAGGMRYRLLEALSHGAAVVATPVAARGSGAVAGEHYLEVSHLDDWARALDELGAAERRYSLGQRGRQWVAVTHGDSDLEARVRHALDPVLSMEGEDA
jgi:hypothetical protein